MAPSSTSALVVTDKQTVEVAQVPVPAQVRPEYVLVKVHAVALNPTDWKRIVNPIATNPGARAGCDYAGIVEEVGSKVTNFKKGDRIAGMTHGSDQTNHNNGSFGEYIEAKAQVQMHIPDHLSFEQAATLGVGVITCGQGLYKTLELPLPNAPAKEPIPILIHGGSTATGVLGIQFAKASGLTVIATASPRHFEYLKSLGADAVFDYHSPTCGAEIRELTKNKLRHAWACAFDGEAICAAALSDELPSLYAGINMPVDEEALKKNPLIAPPLWTIGYDIFGEDWVLRGNPRAGRKDELDFATKFVEIASDMLAKGKLVTSKPTVNAYGGSGLEGVIEGLDVLRAGKVSGEKLVYTL